MQDLLGAIVLPDEVVNVVLVLAEVMATLPDQERAVDVILSAVLLAPIRAKDPLFFSSSLTRQRRRENLTRLKVDNCPAYAPRGHSPILQNDSGPRSRGLLRSFLDLSPERTFGGRLEL